MESQITNLLLFTIPTIITGGIAFLLFKQHFKNETERRVFEAKQKTTNDLSKESLPLRLQAYERMSLFLERISPNNILIRVNPLSNNKADYENLLIQNIEQEFEHNLAQQIYITDDCWTIVNTAKNATIQLIRKSNMSEKVTDADKLREVILTDQLEKPAPTLAALSFIRNEVQSLWS